MAENTIGTRILKKVTQPVPRHHEINEYLAKHSIKMLENQVPNKALRLTAVLLRFLTTVEVDH